MGNFLKIRALLVQRGILLEKEMSEEEISEVEKAYDLVFPEPLRTFYMEMLPVSEGFVNWRDRSAKNRELVKRWIQSPIDEILAVIKEEENDDPVFLELREELKKDPVAFSQSIPKMIPIYSHRYLPAIPGDCHPVFSIVGDDVIIYGRDLEDYFQQEFGDTKRTGGFALTEEILAIPVWGRLL